MITVGTLLLLFVAYQLWGTGIRTAQAQNRLDDELAAQLEAADEAREDAAATTHDDDDHRRRRIPPSRPRPGATTTSTVDTLPAELQPVAGARGRDRS